MKHIITRAATAAVLICTTLTIQAAAPKPAAEGPRTLSIELGTPFRDHAVLQRGMAVPVWGWSKPGTKVTVEFAGQKTSATAGKDGKWMAQLKDLKASFKPAELVISEQGGKKETLTDILVGEVWMASGQSNMQWKIGKCYSVKPLANELTAETEGKVAPIREFTVTSVTAQLFPIKKVKTLLITL